MIQGQVTLSIASARKRMASGLEFITLPRPTVPVNLHKDNLAQKIPGGSPLASVLICLTMDEVLKHDSVYDGVTFMKRLKLLLERNMYRLFYKCGSESEYTLRRTKWQGGRDTGIRGCPLFNWNEKEDVLEVDWSGTDDDRQLELALGRKFAEYIGCVEWKEGDAVNEWYYGPHLTLAPKYNGAVDTPQYLKSEQAKDLRGPIYYTNNGGFFGFRNHAKYRFINTREWFTLNTVSAYWDKGVAKDSMVYVYSNVGRGAILGGQITDLLRQVPVRQDRKEGFVYYEPKNMQHIDVRNTVLERHRNRHWETRRGSGRVGCRYHHCHLTF